MKKIIEHLLLRSNKVPTAVRSSMMRVADAMKKDLEPDSEDLGLCFLFLVEEDRKRSESHPPKKTMPLPRPMSPQKSTAPGQPTKPPGTSMVVVKYPIPKPKPPPKVNPELKPSSPFRRDVEAMVEGEHQRRTRRILGLDPNKKE